MKHVVACAYAIVALALAWSLLTVYTKHPLFPFQMSKLSWTRAWLVFSVKDFYGLVLAFTPFLFKAHEPWVAISLLLAMSVLGSPMACAYVAWRFWRD